MHLVLRAEGDDVVITPVGRDGSADGEVIEVPREAFPAEVARLESQRPRWVWDDTTTWYPALIAAGVRVERCVDLRLSHAILRNSELTAASELARGDLTGWDQPVSEIQADDGLFSLEEAELLDPIAEFALQHQALESATEPARLRLLLAAESAGALVAVEMQHAGLPWVAEVHERLLEEALGPRPVAGEQPAKLAAVGQRVRDAIDAPRVNLDSQHELLKALQHAGLQVESTRQWDIMELKHPVAAPLLEYKKLSRLFSANGWHWLDQNVCDGRFHPDYVVGGVVTGRWASKGGGGALQLPKQVRQAVVADAGWRLVVADASQLEPRILAAMSGDAKMAKAGQAIDMYQAIVDSGAVATRDQAKVAMLGAMYGATTGESGRLMPGLTRAYPQAIGLVESAARAGERGESVTTWLGRSSPKPGAEWREAQSRASSEDATESDVRRARGDARSWGRFTRNFVVQGTAAEWAMAWMASLRLKLWAIGGSAWLTDAPHLVFFLHDEIVVHTPEEHTEAVVNAIRDSAADASRLLFGSTPVDFPLAIAPVTTYADAK
ncbi:bifunctional 3'-5' exonuclease/DNA polymerase [Cryobacterium sp. BB736]|uniref:bifunctional 3'-5' exonuclease/DNA polymerase n=1 Tax=Cryobacterium sp. BB736 TaxID=2746963 RepID=UPI00187720AB